MKRYTQFILKYKKTVIAVFFLCALICIPLSKGVGVDYDFADYLPDDAASTQALDVMYEEYEQAIPNARVMVYDVTIAQALEYKQKLQDIDGVEEVNWLDDAISIDVPLEAMDQDTVDSWYKDGNALFQLTVDEDKGKPVIDEIRAVIGEDNCMSGDAVSSALTPVSTSKEVQSIILFAVPVIFIILLLTTNSWFEPILFLLAIGVAILLNRGTNLMFGTISFVTNAAGSILQLAVSMDYAIFLLHRFAENREEGQEVREAMSNAVQQSIGSILSSGLTTVSGFAALILMRFKIGPDMGWVMVKAIVFSLLCVLCLLPAMALCSYKLIDKTQHRPLVPSMEKLTRLITKARIPLLAIFICVLIPCLWGQSQNSFYYGGSQVYHTEQTQLGRDSIAIEEEYGTKSTVVLMVPKGEIAKESMLNDDLKQIDGVTSVISYVNSVSAVIPVEMVPESTLSQLYSENYSRFVVTLDTAEGQENWSDLVNEVRSAGETYYGEKSLYAGDLVSTEDLRTTVQQDSVRVNLLAILFVLAILIWNFKSITLPIILTLVIEASIWINLSIPYFQGTTLYYIGYLIITSVQLGATIDYGILFANRYLENRRELPRKGAAQKTLQDCLLSILTSAGILALCGTILGKISTNGVLSQLGILLGRGAVISFVLVIVILPTLLALFDRLIEKTTHGIAFCHETLEEIDADDSDMMHKSDNKR